MANDLLLELTHINDYLYASHSVWRESGKSRTADALSKMLASFTAIQAIAKQWSDDPTAANLKALAYLFIKYDVRVDTLSQCFRSIRTHDAQLLRVGAFRSFRLVCKEMQALIGRIDEMDWSETIAVVEPFFAKEIYKTREWL